MFSISGSDPILKSLYNSDIFLNMNGIKRSINVVIKDQKKSNSLYLILSTN